MENVIANNTQASSFELDHERLISLINSMADAVVAIDSEDRIVLYNAAALNLLDINNISHLKKLSGVLKPIDQNNHFVEVESLVKKAERPFTTRDLRIKYSDGSYVNLYINIAPVRLGYGKSAQTGYVILLRDITREKSLEEERDEFISVVSHELRTPIAISEGNIGNAQYIAENSGDMKAIKTALHEAHNQVIYLSEMINDLSTLSRADRGKLQVSLDTIDIVALVKSLVSSYTDQAAKKGLKLHYSIDHRIADLQSTKLYVQEILQNFLTNAIKYTARGEIKLEVNKVESGVEFKVIDSGIGISKRDQERVFDKFFRSEDFRTRQVNGTGLGLYVTAKLAHILHAEIELTSELNKGSSFSVVFPNLSSN